MRELPLADPGDPDLRSPARFMLWVASGQRRTLAVGLVWGVLWMGAQALLPAAVGRAIDDGVAGQDAGALLLWAGVVLGLALLQAGAGVLRHRTAVSNWLQASFRVAQLVGHQSARVGEALPRRIPTGEVVSTVTNDAMRFGGAYDVTARFAGAVVSYVVVAVVLLHYSVELGLLVLLGVPLLTGLLGLLIKPLQQRQAAQREEAGRLTTLGADTVAGLRVLRGIGGEQTFVRRYDQRSQRVRTAGVRVAGVQATLDSAEVLLPGIFVVAVTWLGARFAIDGRISVGQLVAFYGYAAFLVTPLRTATETVDKVTRAYVGARKVIAVLRVRPDIADGAVAAGAPGAPGGAAAGHVDVLDPRGGELSDPQSGLVVRPGRLTAVVSARPEESAALADRLGRFVDVEQAPVTLDGVPLAALPLAEVRRSVVVSETDPRLFTGPLRHQLLAGRSADEEQVLAAVQVASADDVLDALPDGLDSEVEERGRSFSGGQRQRLALIRALLTDAPTLVLVEPTSAVDAHTEARIAARLRQARDGRTTVVMTASPLLLDHADHVVLLEEGRVAAEGTHRELLRSHPGYRDTVVRGEDA